jgi:nuclear transport factor 2 (NTF2) superfamily protein
MTQVTGSVVTETNSGSFDELGLMCRREASINDRPIFDAERKFFWPAPGPRPADHTGIPGVE